MHLFIFQHVSISDVDSLQDDQKVEKAKEGKSKHNAWEILFCFVFISLLTLFKKFKVVLLIVEFSQVLMGSCSL